MGACTRDPSNTKPSTPTPSNQKVMKLKSAKAPPRLSKLQAITVAVAAQAASPAAREQQNRGASAAGAKSMKEEEID